jgi:tetratricopeptide (TPR) repeat protein
MQLATRYNREGEREYHAGNMQRAERLYLEAINSNPEYAQAYSNLGLLYQKTGKRAEGLFANRKAIALASGPKRAVVQASSYYNMARIYEDNGDWRAALENYRTALGLREHSAYTKGIARMQQKLGTQ